MTSYLQEKHDALRALYETHYVSVVDLQAILRSDALPALIDELHLDHCSSEWASRWIDDSGAIFRTFKKHKFIFAETVVALQQTLRWRCSVLAPLLAAGTTTLAPFIQCLPGAAYDTFGRPVLRIQLGRLAGASAASRQEILRAYEATRVHLQSCGPGTLQCVVIVDFKQATMRSMAVELVPWFIRDVAPRFPGMCAGVLMVNYSWAYSGMYGLVKRMLPSNVLERISFPSQRELLSYIERDRLPREYGGDLDLSGLEYEPLSGKRVHTPAPHPTPQLYHDSHPCPPSSAANLSSYLPSTSLLNPWFGYPVVSGPGSSIPQLKNGRRRKRDLARTLALLWLAKLKRTADNTWLWIIMTVILWVAEFRR